ncbi:hypothetical protein AAG906_007664 [Vitis piasezkii]
MGCICSKGSSVNEYVEKNARDKELSKNRLNALLLPQGEGVVGRGSKPSTMEVGMNAGQPQMTRIVSMGNGVEAAQAAAGWPSWLTAVAAEAIDGWVPRKADSFERLDKIGQGTYSSVYKARDLETGKTVALKKVRFANMDPESVRFMAREIHILRRLDHPNVMKLEGLITSRMSGSLYLVFEYMDHDLAGLASSPKIKFTEPQIKCYMQQLLRGLEHCHSRGVLHRDIKGSNLLIDNNGNLKIGDFGLATFFQPYQKQPLTSRVVTLWYRPPELLLGATSYGVAVDLWSAGCILAELYAGKPIMQGRTEVLSMCFSLYIFHHYRWSNCIGSSNSVAHLLKSIGRAKLPHATIFKPQHPYRRCVAETFSDFLHHLSAGSASSALHNEFFTTKPLPCDTSNLPKYPPSKEFDAKLREEEARRRRAAGSKGRGHESTRKVSRESKAVPAPDANAELQVSIQKRREQSNPKSKSEKFIPEEDGGSGFPIEPTKGTTRNGFSHSGKSIHPTAFGSARNMDVNEDEAQMGPGRGSNSSRNGAELRIQKSYSHREDPNCSSRFDNDREWNESALARGRCNARYNELGGAESSEKHQWSHHLLDRPKSSHKKDEQPSERGHQW